MRSSKLDPTALAVLEMINAQGYAGMIPCFVWLGHMTAAIKSAGA